MTFETPLWLQDTPSDVGYSAAADRTLVGAAFYPGAVDGGDLKVTERGAGANMTVDVAAGSVVIEGTPASRGRYLCRSTAVTSVSVGAAPGTGDTRLDLVYAVVADAQYSGTDNEWEILLAAGTPDPSPVLPTVPSNAIALASIEVDDATTSITDAKITDLRSFARQVTVTDRVPSTVPGEDGQLLVREVASAPDQLWARASGSWLEFAPVSQTQFETASLALQVLTETEATWDAPLVLAAPGRACAVQVTHVGAGTGTGGFSRWIEVSEDGGSTWPHRSVNLGFTALTETFTVLCSAPTGAIAARVRVLAGGLPSNFEDGTLNVLVVPVS